ncbi:MAG: ABC transporter permease [Armatimonadetes bacterium]|nr:ABC transporter permease [Armatimonadota bacterium]
MAKYVLHRLLLAIPTLLVLSLITFLLSALAPGDPVALRLGQHADPAARARLRHELGLDRPLHEQYFTYLGNAVRGDFGKTYRTEVPVREIMSEGIPYTFTLAFWAMAVAVAAGIGFGVLAAVYQNTWVDRAAMVVTLIGVSIPAFVLAPLLILLLAVRLGWLPVAGWEGPQYLILPALVLAGRPAALIARLTRTQMVEVLRQDYIRTAYAKGLTRGQVIRRHALRNALLPVLTVIGTAFGYLLTGSFVVETIFAIPGVGMQSISAIFEREYLVIQATVMLAAVGFVLVNLLVDLLYGILDPRVRAGFRRKA